MHRALIFCSTLIVNDNVATSLPHVGTDCGQRHIQWYDLECCVSFGKLMSSVATYLILAIQLQFLLRLKLASSRAVDCI